MNKNIQTYNFVRETINDYLSKFRQNPDIYREREIVIFCTYSSLDDYYIGCGWKYISDSETCSSSVYYVLNNELCNNFTEQMYKDIQLELERKMKEALVENRIKELEKDFV